MSLKIITVGKIKENYLVDGINEYMKRIKPYASIDIHEIKEVNTSDVKKNILEEGRLILNCIKPDDEVIVLAIEGKQYSSVEFANIIKNHFDYNGKPLVFIIGGSDGLSDEVKSRSNLMISFGKMTFPHQVMRLILMEQLYRAYMINNNKKYHK